MFPVAAAAPPLPALLSPSGAAWCRGRSLRFCRDPQKLLRVRVCFRRHASALCVFLRALISYQAHTWHSAFFFLSNTLVFLKPRKDTISSKQKLPLVAGVSGEEWAAVTAVQESHCEVSALSDTSLLCAATFVPQQLLRFVCAWSFGIFDIFRIFPLPLSWFRASRVRRGAPCVVRSPLLCCVLLRLFRRPPDLVWSLLRYY